MRIMNGQKVDSKSRQVINPIAAAVTGVVVGAGMGVAGTIILKDKKNREKVKHAFTNVKDKTMGYIENLQNPTQEEKEVKEPKKENPAENKKFF